MRYFVIDLEYSQTDKSTVIIPARDLKDAVEKAKFHYPNAKYRNVIRIADKMLAFAG